MLIKKKKKTNNKNDEFLMGMSENYFKRNEMLEGIEKKKQNTQE